MLWRWEVEQFTKKILQPIADDGGGFFVSRTPSAVGNIMKTETIGSDASAHRHAPLWLVVTAFAAVYIIWGSTYLGIRYAVQSIPPMLMAGSRHFAAGLLLFLFARPRSAAPTLKQWRDSAIAGTLLLVIGNGGVTWAEQQIPSATAALLVALVPLWMVVLDWLRPGGTRPRALIGLGLAVGFVGVAMLARGHGEHRGTAYTWSVIALMAASIGWAYGSIFNRSANKPSSPFLGVAMQMICGGMVLFMLAACRGEFGEFNFSHVTALSLGSWMYLTIAGSLVGYTAYIWLLHVSTPARVATYAYVNPLIAVLLGCTLGHETFSHDLFAAGALIIVAVILIVRGAAKPASKKILEPKAEAISPVAE